MSIPASLYRGFDEARIELAKAFTLLKQNKTLAQVNIIERVQQKALQTLANARSSAEMSFALIKESDTDKLEWQYRYGHRLGREGKNPASLAAPHLEGFFDGQKKNPSLCDDML